MITVKQYEKVLERLSEPRRTILIKYYLNGAPFDDTNEIAEVLNYPNMNTANLQIGSIGRFISQVLGIEPSTTYSYQGKERPCYFTLVHDYSKNGWSLVKNLVRAMENKGLVKAQSTKLESLECLDTEINNDEVQLRKEGKIVQVFVNKYERDKKLVEDCLKKYNRICQGCEIDFGKVYGSDIRKIIHVHHKKPLHEIRSEEYKDPVKDLIPLCPNCHAVVHSTPQLMSIEDLKDRIKRNKSLI